MVGGARQGRVWWEGAGQGRSVHSSASPTHTVCLLSGNLKGTDKMHLIRI